MPSSTTTSIRTVESYRSHRSTLSPPKEDWNRRKSSPIFPAAATNFESLNSVAASGRRSTLSPSIPTSPRSPSLKSDTLSSRLRSNSGLSLHTNSSALRRYTDYEQDGSLRLSQFDPVEWRETASPPPLPPPLTGNRASMAFHGNGSSPSLGIPDFFSREVVQMVLNNPTTAHRMWQFAQSRGGGENMEFLMAIQDYNKAINKVTSAIATISTSFTSITATTPLRLPPQLSRSVNADVKHISSSILPGLEFLFAETKNHIEQRIMKEIYPEFVKHQLSLCMKTSLSGPRATATAFNFAYPGLGDSFCLTDPYKADNPIVYASDGFINATGYSRSEVIPRNCRFLQGPLTDGAAVLRIKEAISSKVEAVDLVLNYRKDGQPFWNLLFICPLKATNGKVRFYLGGQINVSETIGSHKDVLRILNYGSTGGGVLDSIPPELDPVPLSPLEPPPPLTADSSSRKSRRLERGSSIRRRDRSTQSKPPNSSKSSFFNPFRKQPQQNHNHNNNNHAPPLPLPDPPASPTYISPPPSRHGVMSRAGANASATGLEQMLNSRSAAQHLSLATQMDDFYATYSRFMVLQFVPSSSYAHAHSRGAPPTSSRLKVTFCSRAALDAVGLGPGAHEAVLYHDIFSVLSELAGSPSVTPAFKSAVRERVCVGDAVSLEMLIPAPTGVAAAGASRKGSIITLGGGGGGGGRGDDGRKMSDGFSRERGMRTSRLMSHWTPLKDGDGTVCWVVLVITPAVVGV